MSRYRRFLATFSLLLLVLFVSSLASAKSNPGEPSAWRNQPPSLQTEPVSTAETPLDVFITDEGVFPPVLTVSPGMTIRWTNQTNSTQNLEGISATAGPQTIYLPLIFNNATSQSNKPAGNETLPANTPATTETAWQSGDILPGSSFSHTFAQSGTYIYTIITAPTLTGEVVVQGESFAPAIASIITVDTKTDDRTINGNCTLREAIIAANTNKIVDKCPAGSASDIIALGSGVYNLTLTGKNEDAAAKGDLDITSSITIGGTGDTVIDAKNLSDRIFHVGTKGKLTLKDMTLTNGLGFGGGIYNKGTLTLERVTIKSNKAVGSDLGGGLANDGQATINASTVSGNTAVLAAGIFNRGILTINNSTVSGNTAGDAGGGIKNEGTLTLKHSTISNNTAQHGGGVANFYYGSVKFQNSIIAGNIASADTSHADCDNIASGSLGYNLVGNNTGCPTVTTDLTVNPGDVFLTVLGPLQNNDGSTETHALLSGSPAIDAVPLEKCSFTTDQRGIARPQNAACDIGSFELEVVSPILVVNTAADTDDGQCDTAHCTLREAINAANARPNTLALNEIQFNIPPGGPQVIQLLSALPVITDPVKIDGGTQPGYTNAPIITLDGSQAGAAVTGLNLNTGTSTIQRLTIRNFSTSGIQVTSGISNTILSNSIFSNTLGIDLGGDGVTPNDAGIAPNFDPDAGANNLQNFPVLSGAFPDGSNTRIEGRLNSTANATFTLEFFTNPTCDASNFGEGQTFLGTTTVTTDGSGDAVFTDAEISFPQAVPLGQFVTATATGPDGTSEFSKCVPVSLDNDSWPTALRLSPTAEITQFLDQEGQSRWYKFTVQPNSRVTITLTDLPANYDLTLYKDIQVAFDELTNPDIQDLIKLNAEFASDGFAGDAVARGARSPDAIARGARSPDAFATTAFSPDAIARGARSPDALARGARSPESFAPDAFAPDAYSPDALARGARSDDAIARGARSPEVFSIAQTVSLIGISAFEGTAGEGILANTWNNTGDFYIRVKGRNGAFSLDAPFRLEVTLTPSSCSNLSPLSPANFTAPAGNFRTIILTDLARMEGTPAEIAALQERLATFAARSEVVGAVVDVGADARVATANAQADAADNYDCPYAKNLVAGAIKDIITAYRAPDANPNLAYVVLVGNDDVIPFFRYPDRALLGPESDYIPPVDPFTPSEASLRLDYVLGQDEYGSEVDLSVQVSTLPIPDLPVGRLVETAADATRMLDAYLTTTNGVVATPASALVTGYDFFADAAVEIQAQLEDGLNIPRNSADSLITGRDVSPLDPSAWTADQLADQLLDNRHDIVFLGGHFSASSALAADYQTRLLSTDLTASPVNLENALIFSIGCHSGYNIVNEDGIPGLTAEPDWAQAFARKGATFIGGTGYQYGDTDFLEYSERIYLEFSRQLRTGSGAVSIGQALVNAKQIYLAQTPQLRALHEKSLIEATIFGLPMLSINMPGARLSPPSDDTIISGVENDFETDDPNGPGAALDLRFADISLNSTLNQSIVQLQDIDDLDETVEALYLSGDSGVLSNPGEPVLPLMVRNVTAPDNLVLRGVGFRGGSYTDIPNVRPLTGAPTTEIRSVHTPFLSDIFYPTQPWSVNYLEALANENVTTRLAVTPAQFKSTSPVSETNTLRRYSGMDFRLYYSNNTTSFGAEGTPALSAAPVIAKVSAPITTEGDVNFRMRVIGDPVAGIQEVWVTYTVCSSENTCNGSWQSLNLTQNSGDSTLWEGLFDLGGTPQNIRYIVQAVNGVGLVSMSTNLGAYYIPGVDEANLQPTALLLDPPAATAGRYSADATFSAVLTDEGGQVLPNQVVIFSLGSQNAIGVTNGSGRATATLPILGTPPNQYEVRAAFPGNTSYAASAAPNTFEFQVQRQDTALTLEPAAPHGLPSDDKLVTATLTDALGRRLFEKTVVFVVTGSGGTYSEAVITNFLGQAILGRLPLPPGTYTVNVYFGGSIPLGNETTITLDDPRYNPASASTGLTLTDICGQVLDNFNLPNGGLSSTNWAGSRTGYSIVNQQAKVGQGGPIYWKPTVFGPDQVACVKLIKLNSTSSFHALMLKVQGLNNYGPGAILVDYNANTGNIDVEVRKSNGTWLAVGSFTPPTPVQEGDRLGARALANGKVELYINDTLVGIADAGSFYANKGGQIGLWLHEAHDAIIDDFAGGNIANP